MHTLAAILAAVAFLPETSPRTIQTSPLAPGEVAVYQEPYLQSATVYVGGSTGELRRVSEPTAIKGYRIEEIPDDDLSISWDSSLSYTNGCWSVRQGSGSIVVSTRSGAEITDYSYEGYPSDASISPANAYRVYDECHGSRLVIYLEATGEITANADSLVLRRVAFGDVPTTNDLKRVTYTMHDELGDYDLKDLRKWARDLYNGNRGEDWAKYKPKSNVQMEDKTITFGKDVTRYGIQQSADSNLVVKAGGYDAVSVKFYGTSTFDGSFAITSFEGPADGVVTLTYRIDADEFDPSEIHVLYRERLETGSWSELSTSAYTHDGSTHAITIPNQTAASGFYRLSYTGTTSNIIEVRFRGTVIVEDALILKGEDDVYYKISVNGGVISATAVE